MPSVIFLLIDSTLIIANQLAKSLIKILKQNQVLPAKAFTKHVTKEY